MFYLILFYYTHSLMCFIGDFVQCSVV